MPRGMTTVCGNHGCPLPNLHKGLCQVQCATRTRCTRTRCTRSVHCFKKQTRKLQGQKKPLVTTKHLHDKEDEDAASLLMMFPAIIQNAETPCIGTSVMNVIPTMEKRLFELKRLYEMSLLPYEVYVQKARDIVGTL